MSEKDLNYINDSDRWVMWPLCPLKRWHDGKGFEFGYLVAGEGPVLRIGNAYAPSTSDAIVHYDDFGELLKEGWRVD
jgi:hypothetical protein